MVISVIRSLKQGDVIDRAWKETELGKLLLNNDCIDKYKLSLTYE